jgi:hypothetical protein
MESNALQVAFKIDGQRLKSFGSGSSGQLVRGKSSWAGLKQKARCITRSMAESFEYFTSKSRHTMELGNIDFFDLFFLFAFCAYYAYSAYLTWFNLSAPLCCTECATNDIAPYPPCHRNIVGYDEWCQNILGWHSMQGLGSEVCHGNQFRLETQN